MNKIKEKVLKEYKNLNDKRLVLVIAEIIDVTLSEVQLEVEKLITIMESRAITTDDIYMEIKELLNKIGGKDD